jgi:hypothetical protein
MRGGYDQVLATTYGDEGEDSEDGVDSHRRRNILYVIANIDYIYGIVIKWCWVGA